MSAIAGVYLLNGDSVDEKDLKRMNDSMPHRGPDGSGLWHDGAVGLAHQMLWTTPESLHETLPFEADGLVITSDSRIDNREELLPELALSEEVSDSEVILKAYGRWGKSCVDRLLGDFAFVIWDKAKEMLFCARDHMGVKPFYYYYQPGEIFIFASEIKALFAWGILKGINEIRIVDYLTAMPEDREITFYRGIVRLPAANKIIVDSKSIQRTQYWELDPICEIRLESDEEYENAFFRIFKEAVKCRLRSAFHVGSMLSGGLDSSSIVCMAREILPNDKQLKTFSIIFETVKECDEQVYINAVLDRGRLDAYYIYGDRIGPLSEIEIMQWHEDQPFFSLNLFLVWALYKEAQNQKVRILLNGTDGDTTISHGFAYITELTGKGKIIPMVREVRGVAKNFNCSPWRILQQRAIYPFCPEFSKWLYHAIRSHKRKSTVHARIINSEFIEHIDKIGRRKDILSAKFNIPIISREDHWIGLTGGIIQLILEEADMAAAAFSIEPRNPFFDKRLVEFCLALPGDQKIRLGWTRWIMRRSLREILPKKIVDRGTKSDLSPNFSYGLMACNRTIVRDELREARCLIAKYINILELDEAYKKFISSRGHFKKEDINIWLVINLSIWIRRNYP